MSKPEFTPINLPEYIPTKVLPFDLYVYFKNQYLCFRKTDTELNEEIISKLRAQQITELYCKSEQIRDYFKYIRSAIEELFKSKSTEITLSQKLDAVQLSTIHSVRYMAANPTDKYAYQFSRSSTSYLLSLLRESPALLEDVIRKDLKEDVIYIHSKNVAALASRMARKAGAKNENVEFLALAGMLHDLGVSHMPENLKEIFYQGSQADKTQKDYQEYLKHGRNLELLLSNTDFIPGPVNELIANHEQTLKTNGNLNLFCQILSLSDKFDKLVTIQKMPVDEALKTFKIEYIGHFDLKLIKILDVVLKEGALLVK